MHLKVISNPNHRINLLEILRRLRDKLPDPYSDPHPKSFRPIHPSEDDQFSPDPSVNRVILWQASFDPFE